MKHLRKFNEELEPELVDAINFLKRKKEEPKEKEDLNLENLERNLIIKAITKFYDQPYGKIADVIGLDLRTLKRKLKEYDLENLKTQLKIRKGVGWDHPYNQIKLERFDGFISATTKRIVKQT